MLELRKPFVDLGEMDKLKVMLNDNGISYDESEDLELGGLHLFVPSEEAYTGEHMDGNRGISVICNRCSYGGTKGLLEIFAPGLNEGVEGYLNAEETLSYIQDTLAGISRGSVG